MERRRHARTPVNINALLIGEKTVPKGCRVINVSQQGMLLYCEADGRLSTFNDGDTVDIHLTVQHAGEQKKLTIPAVVRHVAENSVDVEFLHPDPILTETIESYRVSDKHRLEATFGQNHSSGSSRPLSPQAANRVEQLDAAEDTPRSTGQRPFYLGILILLLALCIVMGGYMYTASIDSRISTLETLSDHQTGELTELRDRVVSSSLQEGRYASLNSRITALTEAFTSLEHRVLDGTVAAPSEPGTGDTRAVTQRPGNTFVVITPPQSAPTATDSDTAAVPPAAAGNDTTPEKPALATTPPSRGAPAGPFPPAQRPARTSAAPPTSASAAEPANSDQPESAGSAQVTAAPAPAKEQTVPAAVVVDAIPAESARPAQPEQADAAPVNTEATNQQQPAVLITSASSPEVGPMPAARQQITTAPWRINLLSSPDRSDIARLAEKAAQLDIPTHTEEALVKGRTWWRLQVTGFDSMSEASQAAEPLKQHLGIADVWILKQ